MSVSRRLFISAILLAGVTSALPATAQQNKIIVGYTSLAGVAPIFIAKENGYFEKRGVDVELQALRGGNVLVPSLIANSVQIATLTAPTLVQAVDGGLDLVGLTTLSVLTTGMTNSGLVARTGTNLKAPQDLVGKRVAVGTIGSISQVLFDKWLMIKGVDPKKLIYVEASFPQMPDIIKGGNVDAVIIPDPLMTAITNAGSGYVMSYFMGEMPDRTVSMVSASARDWTAKNPQQVKAYREAIDEAAAWGMANNAATKDIVGKWLKLTPEIMANTSIDQLLSKLTADDIKWWVDTLNEQKLLRTKIEPAKIVAQ